MARIKIRMMLAVAGLLALAVVALAPHARDAGRLMAAADDPEKLAALALERRFDAPTAVREIEAALKADDAELAQSFLQLADVRGLPI